MMQNFYFQACQCSCIKQNKTPYIDSRMSCIYASKILHGGVLQPTERWENGGEEWQQEQMLVVMCWFLLPVSPLSNYWLGSIASCVREDLEVEDCCCSCGGHQHFSLPHLHFLPRAVGELLHIEGDVRGSHLRMLIEGADCAKRFTLPVRIPLSSPQRGGKQRCLVPRVSPFFLSQLSSSLLSSSIECFLFPLWVCEDFSSPKDFCVKNLTLMKIIFKNWVFMCDLQYQCHWQNLVHIYCVIFF